MKAWSDEWRCAQLRLHLRSEQLFQGETVNVEVCADVAPSSGGSKREQEGQKAAGKLLLRWREHCEDAHVQIQVVQVTEADPHASSSTPSRTTLFRQETQFSHVSVDHVEGSPEPVVKLKAQFDLRVRHDFWGREVLLIVHISPKNGVVGVGDGSSRGKGRNRGLDHGVRGSLGASVLLDEWASSQLLALTREEAQPTPMMTRRVEQRIMVTKPLQLNVETRELAGQRVGILAQASNAHSTLALAVRDLHLHLDQSLRTQNASNRDASRFRIVSGDKVPFPVVLFPQERYNFLFVLEPVELVVTDEPLERSEGVEYEQVKTSTQRTGKSPLAHGSAASTAQHTLLTLSWQAVTVSMDTITENRTIVWSPKAPSRQFVSPTSDENEPREGMQKLVSFVLAEHANRGGKPYADFKCVRLLPDSALHTTIAPLSSSIAIGSAATLCITVANRSAYTDFDLTLMLPSQKEGILEGSTGTLCAAPTAVGFEASHRLGLLRPGMSVRRSLHVAFIRLGKCKLGALVLVDHLTRTCFVSDDWEVFIKN
ncbi:hypothetical protein PRIC1_009145 [Phytophthora ramorum]